MLFAEKIQEPGFIDAVKNVSKNLSINPNWLMLVMYFESGLNPRAVNATTGATGLIQFMPATAQGLGTTTANLKAMTATAQMYFVEKYLKPFAGKLNSFADTYLAVFFPLALKFGRYDVLETKYLSASKIAANNPIFDINKNGKIRKNEILQVLDGFIDKNVPENYKPKFKSKPMKYLSTVQAGLLVLVAIIAVITALRQYN